MAAPTCGWVVAVVKTGLELACVEWLTRRGIDAYTPVGRHMVRDRRPHRIGLIEQARPAFPGYAFIGRHALGGAWRKADGLLHLLITPSGIPLIATVGQIDRIRQRQANGEFNGPMPSGGRRFQVGDKVIITGGPFISFPGVVMGDGRVDVAIFGRRVPAAVDQWLLEAAE